MENDLKPCPFCGSEAELIVTEETWMGPSLVLVKCKNGPCGCQSPTLVNPSEKNLNWQTRADDFNRVEAVVKIWNRRVNDG